MKNHTNNPLRWGILSTAQINARICKAMRVIGGQIPVAIASRNLEKAKTAATELEIPQAYGSYEEVLENPDIDAVYISTPNTHHFKWCQAAIEAGKHVLCEKPLAVSEGQVELLRRLAQKKKLTVGEGMMIRHHPQTFAIKKAIDTGAIGKILLLRISFHTKIGPSPNIRRDPELGGGALWDLGCYIFHLARYLLDSDLTQIQALGRYQDGVDVGFTGQLQFKGGAILHFDCGFDEFRAEALEVVGTHGILRVSRPFKPSLCEKLLITKDKDLPPIEIEVSSELDSYELQLKDFAEAIEKERSPLVTLQQSTWVSETIRKLLLQGG